MHLTNRPFDTLQPGDWAQTHRLITLDDLYIFAASSGNYNPMHLPDGDIDGDGQPERIAPGAFVASLISGVVGSKLPGPGTLYLHQSVQFHARAHAGDEVCCRVEVLEKCADGVVHLAISVRRMGDDALILSGTAKVVAPIRPYAGDDCDLPGLIVQRHRHFTALLARARPLAPMPTAVVCPDDAASLGGALLAARESIIIPILIGVPEAIRAVAHAEGLSLDGIEILQADGARAAAARA